MLLLAAPLSVSAQSSPPGSWVCPGGRVGGPDTMNYNLACGIARPPSSPPPPRTNSPQTGQPEDKAESPSEARRQATTLSYILKRQDAEQAFRSGDVNEALRLYLAAQAILNTPDIRASIAATRGFVAVAAHDYPTALDDLRQASPRVQNPDVIAWLQARIAEEKLAAKTQADRTPVTVGGRSYTPAGRGLIGGTQWIVGYNVQSADPALVAKAHEMMQGQMRLAGLPYADGVDFNRYNFVLGIAASTDAVTDLASRVVFDEYRNGQYSAENQGAYNTLKGRKFDELACHSNGAMVCLAALTNGDVIADKVVLYGPQITVESLRLWDEMVRSKKVRSVQIIVNQGDPVAPVSLAIGGGAVRAGLLSAVALLRTPSFVDVIHETAPRIVVRSFSCAAYPSLACHGMDVYKANLLKAGCRPVSSGRIVPGTSLPGRPDSGVLEPPPVC